MMENPQSNTIILKHKSLNRVYGIEVSVFEIMFKKKPKNPI